MTLILQQIVNGLMLGGVYVMVAVAFTLIIGMLNFLNFTIPALFMVSAMFMWATVSGGFGEGFKLWLDSTVGADYQWIVGALVAIAVAMLASLVIERFTYRYMKARFGDATEHALPLVSSLGFLIIFEHLVIMKWGTDPLIFVSPFADATFSIGPLLFGAPQLISLALSLLLVFMISQMLRRTSMGRALRAIAEKPDTAPLMGIEVNRIVPVVFLMTGFLCAVAGVLFTINYQTISPYVGDEVAVVAIAGMVIGGLGNIWGAIAGGMIVGMIEVLSIHFFGADIVKVPIWGLLLVILIVRPTGLFGAAAIGKGKF